MPVHSSPTQFAGLKIAMQNVLSSLHHFRHKNVQFEIAKKHKKISQAGSSCIILKVNQGESSSLSSYTGLLELGKALIVLREGSSPTKVSEVSLYVRLSKVACDLVRKSETPHILRTLTSTDCLERCFISLWWYGTVYSFRQ